MADHPHPTTGARTRRGRTLAAVGALVGLLVLGAGCGTDVQLEQPYTPAVGVNADVGAEGQVQIRNLKILSRTEGQGFVSGTLSTSVDRDALVEVSGTLDNLRGESVPLTVNQPNPVAVNEVAPVVLTDRAAITVTNPELQAGLTGSLTLTFSSAGEVTLNVPIVDANQVEFQTVSPSPAPSPSG